MFPLVTCFRLLLLILCGRFLGVGGSRTRILFSWLGLSSRLALCRLIMSSVVGTTIAMGGIQFVAGRFFLILDAGVLWRF